MTLSLYVSAEEINSPTSTVKEPRKPRGEVQPAGS